jgi:ketosteroid isomerase-like protein
VAEAELREAIDHFDRAFTHGRLDELLDAFAEDARFLVHEQEPLVGTEAIRGAFSAFFERFDTSAYDPRYEVIDVHGDSGYVLGSFTEVLRPRDGTPGTRVHGRVVQFWRQEGDEWRIRILLTGRSASDEQA